MRDPLSRCADGRAAGRTAGLCPGSSRRIACYSHIVIEALPAIVGGAAWTALCFSASMLAIRGCRLAHSLLQRFAKAVWRPVCRKIGKDGKDGAVQANGLGVPASVHRRKHTPCLEDCALVQSSNGATVESKPNMLGSGIFRGAASSDATMKGAKWTPRLARQGSSGERLKQNVSVAAVCARAAELRAPRDTGLLMRPLACNRRGQQATVA